MNKSKLPILDLTGCASIDSFEEDRIEIASTPTCLTFTISTPEIPIVMPVHNETFRHENQPWKRKNKNRKY